MFFAHTQRGLLLPHGDIRITELDHVFAIPAYGESPFLPGCIESILAQTGRRASILLGTSTPNDYIATIAKRFGLQLSVNPVRADIATDWNFVLAAANSRFVTIAHQDDWYEGAYLSEMTSLAARHPCMIIAFSAYQERTATQVRPLNFNLRIKERLCRRAFGATESIRDTRSKLRLLQFGNPVCCPSVMFDREKIPWFSFDRNWKTNLDWDAWLRLAREPGEFLYSTRRLVSKRVHPGSETSVTIANRVRQTEDRRMFERFWPRPVAATIAAVYAAGYLANRS